MAVTGSSLVDHIIEHEILGLDSSLSNLKVSDDILWVRDSTRDKWLSSNRFNIFAARKGKTINGYLPLIDGLSSGVSSYRIIRPATIVAVAAHTKIAQTWTLRMRRNNTTIEIVSLSMVDSVGNHNTSTDVNLDEGDIVQFYANTSAFDGVKNVLVWAEIAWRNNNL